MTEEKVNQESTVEEVDMSAQISKQDAIVELQNQVRTLQEQLGNNSGGGQLELLVNMLGDALANRQTQGGDATGQFSFNKAQANGTYDPNDVLPEAESVTFVSHRSFYVIADDLRNGVPVRVPKGLIKFDYSSTKVVKSGKEKDLIHLSTYTCRSRKELQWLREHSHFGITFFDKISTALTIDVIRGASLARKHLFLQNIGQHQLLQMAKTYQIPVGDDLNLLRIQIAEASVNAEMEKRKDHTTSMLLEQQLEAEAIGKENAQS